ncbi:glycosyl transferase [Microbacterium halophytorum]|uniref:glycosyl transferase n=1 Tax=Microbacterium halophytorum TaxID=2067568 RepID=UPI000CFDF3AA|nr:glycosyl transferase [Microbacterium halophytorum]
MAFILAAGLIAVGVAQRTVLLGPDSETITVSSEEDLPYTVIDSDVFEALPEALPGERGTLTIESEGPIFATYARTLDVEGWLSDQTYTRASADGGSIDVATVAPTAEIDGESPVRTPAGSDLWLEEFTAEGSMEENFTFPEGMELSVLIASDGEAAAPETIEVTWPIDNSTPSAPWFIGAGIAMLVLGIILYIFAVLHARRSRGPRRKGQPVPLTGPVATARDKHAASPLPGAAVGTQDALEEGEDARGGDAAGDDGRDGPSDDDANGTGASGGASGSGSGSSSGPPEGGTARRTAATRRGWRLALPALGLSAALLAGCTPDAPAEGPSPSPSATADDTGADAQQPAVTESQAARIVADVSAHVTKADEERDADVADDRLTGVALAMREVNYSLGEEIDDYGSLPGVPAEPIVVLLPQAYDGWPRSVMAVVEDAEDETVAPTMLALTQEDPWSDYRATYISQLRPSAEIPDLAPAYQGTALVPPDSSFLQVAPQDLAGAYASILGDGEESEYASLFDIENDGFYAEVQDKRAQTKKNFDKTGEETGDLTFDERGGDTDPFSLLTLHSGAIVGVSVVETEQVTPAEGEDQDRTLIKFEDDAVLKALTGEEESAGGVKTEYVDQLFFYVPAKGSEEKIQLLGASSSIRDATILEVEDDGDEEETAE